jgi:hypothetical protein
MTKTVTAYVQADLNTSTSMARIRALSAQKENVEPRGLPGSLSAWTCLLTYSFITFIETGSEEDHSVRDLLVGLKNELEEQRKVSSHHLKLTFCLTLIQRRTKK